MTAPELKSHQWELGSSPFKIIFISFILERDKYKKKLKIKYKIINSSEIYLIVRPIISFLYLSFSKIEEIKRILNAEDPNFPKWLDILI
jgi:hypothetical protein